MVEVCYSYFFFLPDFLYQVLIFDLIHPCKSECTKLKKELQEQHKDIQYLTLESNRSHETARIATREVEAVKQELIEERKNVERIKENFIRDITFSDMS